MHPARRESVEIGAIDFRSTARKPRNDTQGQESAEVRATPSSSSIVPRRVVYES
jgi:hypothetical protein